MVIALLGSTAFSAQEYLEKVTYIGAFGLTNWANGWTALEDYAILAPAVAAAGSEITVTDASINAGDKVYWTAGNTYVLSGFVFVEEGAELYIEAGTVIKAQPGESENASALIVARGGKIFAEGTADRPIIFTALEDDLDNPAVPAPGAQGLWGGVVILGKAPINPPAGEANIEGIPTTEPRGLYGGSDEDDCSGVFRYVSIRHAGSKLGEGNEINGLTLGGVGRQTVISYVEVFANLDDGFEWFGGTVNCDHLISAFCGDDCFDFDFGMNNKMQFLFAIQADTSGDHCGEHDGAPETNTDALPHAYPVVYNATYLGAGMEGTSGSRTFRLREGWGGEYNNSIFGDYNGYAMTVEDKYDYDARDRMEAGELKFRNNLFFGYSAGDTWDALGHSEAWTVAHLGSNNNAVSDPQLMGISRAVGSFALDPRPAQDGDAFETDMAAYPRDEDFFVQVNYKGAFGLSNWAAGWTALSAYGIMAEPQVGGGAEIVVTDTDINAGDKVFWTANNTYILDGFVYVEDGAELNIEAGAVVKAAPGESENASALIVAKGGKIFAEGSADRPIIFTAQEDDLENPAVPAPGSQGLWGGVVILGNAVINPPAGEANIEGIPTTEPRGMYGGSDNNDCSGILQYVSIRHAGSKLGEGNEINGLTLGGVGSETKISYIEVFANLDDGFEWFGGTVNCDHLISAFCGDDCFDFDFGMNNKMQFLFAIQADTSGDHCGEHDGAPETNTDAMPYAYPAVYNATYLGAGITGTSGSRTFRLREGFGGEYKNSIFGDYNGYAMTVEDKYDFDARDRMEAGGLTFANDLFFAYSAGSTWEALGHNEAWTVASLSAAANMNQIADPMLNGISRAVASQGLDPRPGVEGPAFDGPFADVLLTSVVETRNSVKPSSYSISQNYPNPFNPATMIEYTVVNAGLVSIKVYNQLGQQVATLVNGVKNTGQYTITWDASELSSGVYFYRYEAGNTVEMRKMVLVK